ncbi:MAG: Lrp/AsnC family transcriptional regulator [Syntrophaceae bacterium]
MLDELDKAILALAQGDLPLDQAPFDCWAAELGVETAELLRRLAALKAAGVIRDFKAILRHRQAGMHANAMVVWAVPEARMEEVGRLMAQEAAVTHCYERPAFGEFTLFSMLHARSVPELLTVINQLAEKIGIRHFKVYASERELKKASMRYF